MDPPCLLCRSTSGVDGLCNDCRIGLPRIPAARCPVCAIPTPTGDACGRCLERPPHFDRVAAALLYQYPASLLVQDLKYRGNLSAARALAGVLCDALDDEPYPDLVLPMPLARGRIADRGFNQAMEIARHVAAEFGLRVVSDACRRTREGTPQAALPWKERARNVRKAFACDADFSGKRIAIIDDVLTTGATLDELARTLKRCGALEVVGWIVARTPPPGAGGS